LRLAQAACGASLAYAAVSVYWALGGTWLLDIVAGTLAQQGRTGVTSGQATMAGRRLVRVLAWLEAAILTIYGLVRTDP